MRAFDVILDATVRDGFVYYRALRADRAKLDAYVAALASVQPDMLSRNEQLAFWLNAYNAVVLQTVVDHYPIQGSSPEYPAQSIRQVPGAFERLTHQIGGRTVTLDQIEQTILPEFRDPRVYLLLGRGAVGSGRLRSEALRSTTLEAQLTEAAGECLSRPTCVQIDREAKRLLATPIFSWHEQEFVGAYAAAAPAVFSARSPIERAILAFVDLTLLPGEREAISKAGVRFAWLPFDWSLNDLTGRGGQ